MQTNQSDTSFHQLFWLGCLAALAQTDWDFLSESQGLNP